LARLRGPPAVRREPNAYKPGDVSIQCCSTSSHHLRGLLLAYADMAGDLVN
jgi:hypothetical protein